MLIDIGTLVAILYAVVGVMIIVVLYHVLFILVDLRKIARRFEDLTSQVEAVLLKPLSLADQGIQWVIDFVQAKAKQHKKAVEHKAHHAHDKHRSEEDQV